jgi:hypothetical protein
MMKLSQNVVRSSIGEGQGSALSSAVLCDSNPRTSDESMRLIAGIVNLTSEETELATQTR